jgi:hypothetical protein
MEMVALMEKKLIEASLEALVLLALSLFVLLNAFFALLVVDSAFLGIR